MSSGLALIPQSYYYEFQERGINAKDMGAKGDGVTDDTAAINNALKNGGIVFIPAGTYMVNSGTTPLDIPSNTVLYMSPLATIQVITNSQDSYNVFQVRQRSNVRIIGGNIVGDRTTHTGTTGQFGYGINVTQSNNVYIEDVTITNCWGDGMILSASGGSQSDVSTNLRVVKCIINNNRRNGISVTGCEDLVIDSCRITNSNGSSPQYGIDLEPDYSGVTNKRVTIINSYLYNNTGAAIGGNAMNEDIRIVNCTLDGGTVGAWSFVCPNVTTSFTVVENCTLKGVVIYAHNVKFKNCRFYIDGTYQSQYSYQFESNTDSHVLVEDSEFYAQDARYWLNIAGSTSDTDPKTFRNCTFTYDGNANANLTWFTNMHNFVEFTKCRFLHTGSALPSGTVYIVGGGNMDGETQIFEECYADPVYQSQYGFNGWFSKPRIRAEGLMSSVPTSGFVKLSAIVYNSNPAPGGNVGWVCTTEGYACGTAWASGSTYSAGTHVYCTDGNVYSVTTAGAGTSTVAPSNETTPGADGYQWALVGTQAVFKTFGTIGT